MERRKISVATACYNSESFIERTFQSILAQEYANLEWNVVIDGVTDSTLSMVEDCKRRAPFQVNIIVFEKNRGGTVSVTTAVHSCVGDFAIILDHDDELMPRAIHDMLSVWDRISENEDTSALCGVFGRCVNERNELLGPPIPDVTVAPLGYFIYAKRCRAECACLFRTDVLKAYYHFAPDEIGSSNGLVWNRMSRAYKSIFTDLIVRRYHTNTPGSQSSSRKIRSPGVLANQELEVLNDNAEYLVRDPVVLLRKLALYQRYSFHAQRGLLQPIRGLRKGWMRLAAASVSPIALWFAFGDRRAGRVAQ